MAAHQRPVMLLIVSHDVVDARMAGPGIRYWELARVLARHVPVTLAVPGQTTLSGDGFGLHVYQPGDWETLRPAVEGAGVLMPCGHTLTDFPALAEGDRPLIIDGYDPVVVEALAHFAGESLVKQKTRHERVRALVRRQCQAGDFFICASERQRDWWLGQLEARGRVNPHTFADDPTLRRLVDVVPFGLPAEPPQHTRPVLKGVVRGIGPDDRVILWGGGIWEWLDPLTVVRAMAEVVRQRPDARLVFPGTRHPNVAAVPDMPVRQRAIALAQSLGLLGRQVFFGSAGAADGLGWVDYAEWPSYLCESDVGVSLHLDTVETRLAFRTRVLTYIWAGLPMVVTRGDATSAMVAQRELGRVVGFEDVDGVTAAVLDLLEAPAQKWQARFAETRAALTWERVAEPLVAFCQQPRRAADRQGTRPGDPVKTLETRLERQGKELDRLRELVGEYERGRFMRLMRFFNRMKGRVRVGGKRDC